MQQCFLLPLTLLSFKSLQSLLSSPNFKSPKSKEIDLKIADFGLALPGASQERATMQRQKNQLSYFDFFFETIYMGSHV